MKLNHVFALVPDCHVAGWRYADVWRRHFYDGLERTGITIQVPRQVNFKWARPPQSVDPLRTARERSQTSEVLLNQILRSGKDRPQVVLSCCFSHDLELDLVDRVRAAGIPWVNFFCDSVYAFDWVSALAARTSLNWFVESEAEERYRMLGVPWMRAPYALNPEALPDAGCKDPRNTLLFAGTASPSRIRTAAWLRLFGTDLQVCGWGWMQSLGPLPDSCGSWLTYRAARAIARKLLRGRVQGHLGHRGLLEQLRRAVMVLGLNEGGSGPKAGRYLKLRDLEFPGMGCCYLAQHHTDLSEVFKPGWEIYTFQSPWEARCLANDLARHPKECLEVGRRSRARVLQEHTWAVRLPQIAARL